MSLGDQFYIITLLVYFAVDTIAALGLSVQFTYAGIPNFGFIVLQAAGAYTAAVLTLGTRGSQTFQHYFIGAKLPFPIPIIAAMAVGALLAVLMGAAVSLRGLRRDYQAVVYLIMSVLATDLVENFPSFLNSSSGLSLIPEPLSSQLNLDYLSYHWIYAVYALVLAGFSFLVVRYLHWSPLGLAWRALRDSEVSAVALGKKAWRLKLAAMAIGGALAGLSGAVLVEFVTAWSPAAWLFPETVALFTALILGGLGNNIGVVLGVLLVPVGLFQATSFLPEFYHPGFIDAMEWVVMGVAILVVLRFFPRGIVPERPRNLQLSRAYATPEDVHSAKKDVHSLTKAARSGLSRRRSVGATGETAESTLVAQQLTGRTEQGS